MIPDSLWVGLFGRVAEPLTRRSEPGEQTAAIDEADVQVAEAHDMVAGFEFSNAHEFVDQRLADEDKLTLPFDHACAADAADLMICVIPGVLLA
jgi:hypothetical protein